MSLYIGNKQVAGCYVGTRKVKKIYVGTGIVWQEAQAMDIVPILPGNLNQYPLRTAAGIAAVDRISGRCGYYDVSGGTLSVEAGMTGDIIYSCDYIEGDGSAYITTDKHLTGADTVTLDFMTSKSGCNVFGCFTSSSADDNFCLYASSNSSYVRYDGSVYRNLGVSLNTRHTYIHSATGASIDGVEKHTWAQQSFTCGSSMYIFMLPNSTSAKLEGRVYSLVIAGKANYVPVKAGSAYYLLETDGWELPTHVGTFTGGTTGNPLALPTA